MFDFTKFFDWNYLADPYPSAPSTQTLYILLGIFVFFIIFGVGEWFWLGHLSQKYPPYLETRGKLLNFFLTFGILGLVLLFFRFETLPYLASRLMLALLVAGFIIWGGYLLYYFIRVLPTKIKHSQKQTRFIQYLPTSKKRRK